MAGIPTCISNGKASHCDRNPALEYLPNGISARCQHYEHGGVNLIWVLYGVDPTTDDTPQSFRDVVRRHRGNAFVLDDEGIQAFHEQKTIVLKCYLKDGEDAYKPPKLVRIDALTFRGKALPSLEDRITANLKAEIGAQRASWFKALEPYRDNWEWTIVRAPAVKDAIAALSHRFGVISSYGRGEAEEIAVVRLIAIVFTVISAANGHLRNYATRHDNIRAMLNALLMHRRRFCELLRCRPQRHRPENR
ncbi:hypothetical protein ACE102_47675 (plasmid) [Bradyrhizobium sp. vgs-9]|uniref:hypothetical protein n=1 Tax=Bradyrhizobium sp. vgs-9 TaxID=208389 RepID=UPI0035D4D896